LRCRILEIASLFIDLGFILGFGDYVISPPAAEFLASIEESKVSILYVFRVSYSLDFWHVLNHL
jgi:hypothetical protein